MTNKNKSPIHASERKIKSIIFFVRDAKRIDRFSSFCFSPLFSLDLKRCSSSLILPRPWLLNTAIHSSRSYQRNVVNFRETRRRNRPEFAKFPLLSMMIVGEKRLKHFALERNDEKKRRKDVRTMWRRKIRLGWRRDGVEGRK